MSSKGLAVVFGGSGFLGSHVADELQNAGYKVRIFDLRPSPYLRAGQEMVAGDIMNRQQVAAALKGADYVYFFAGIADIDEAHNKPVETAQLNVVGSVNVLDAARAAGIKRFVFASTLYVYSNMGSFYRASKQAAERFIETYQESFGLNYTILRYGSLYGRRADTRNQIYRFLSDALRGKKMVYRGNGQELREYIHVADAAKASVRILEPEFENQHLIITGTEKLRVADLLNMIREITGPSVSYEFLEPDTSVHYSITPYAFAPKLGKKLIPTTYIDLGQGLLDCLGELHHEIRPELKSVGDWLLQNHSPSSDRQ